MQWENKARLRKLKRKQNRRGGVSSRENID